MEGNAAAVGRYAGPGPGTLGNRSGGWKTDHPPDHRVLTLQQITTETKMKSLSQLSDDPRVTVRRSGMPDVDGSCMVYWMQRGQRAIDNPALDLAIRLGNELNKPVVVFFAPVPFYPRANYRHYCFLVDGIADIAAGLEERGVKFVFRSYPNHCLQQFCWEVRPAMVIGDENPLRETEHWRQRVTERIKVPFWTVDADVIVPSKLLGREHVGARTIRPKILELLPAFLQQSDTSVARVRWIPPAGLRSDDWRRDFMSEWNLDRSVSAVSSFRGGTAEGLRRLKEFVREKLGDYPECRNRPEFDGTSRLSPYLHFGHLGPHTVALAIQNSGATEDAKRAFLEQLIVRRELAVNFVRFNESYDSMECLDPWANRSLAQHASDLRTVIYSPGKLDAAETHDPLWNAAHKQMVLTGWMHNYLRMYWAKKILEWSPSIASAYQRCIALNDRYELDGRDPNSYAGIAWAIVGKHDRPWFDRPVFGQVRYMSLSSTGRKFDSKRYIEEIESLQA